MAMPTLRAGIASEVRPPKSDTHGFANPVGNGHGNSTSSLKAGLSRGTPRPGYRSSFNSMPSAARIQPRSEARFSASCRSAGQRVRAT